MSAYIELQLAGGGGAFIEAGTIAGIVTPYGVSLRDRGTPENPVRVLLRGGSEIDVVGEIAGKILIRAQYARAEAQRLKGEHGIDFYVDYLTEMGSPDDAAG